jgi:hypothetical protein
MQNMEIPSKRQDSAEEVQKYCRGNTEEIEKFCRGGEVSRL